MKRVRLDLNNVVFQEAWFALEKVEALQVFASLRKISRLTWDELYRDRGLRWEAIESRTALGGQRLYSFRVTQKTRAVALRDGDFLRLQNVHPDHDSAYP